MSEAAPTAPTRASHWLDALAFGLPAALALACAGNDMGDYDSPELAAAGSELGVTHPPGHPLWVLFAASARVLFPLGSVPWRLSALSALCLGALGVLVLRCAYALCSLADPESRFPRARALSSLASSLAVTLGVAVFRQATRVEVYALAAALSVVPLALVTLPRSPDSSAPRRLRVGALVLGLALCNHHFIALTACLPLALLAAEVLREGDAGRLRRALRLLPPFLFGLLALAPYALVALRADSPGSLPRPHTPAELAYVISARTYARNMGSAVPGSLASRFTDVLDWVSNSLTSPGLLFALAGLYLGLRSAPTRAPSLAALSVLAPVLFARAWLGFVRDNPDAAGYLAPALATLGVTLALFPLGALAAITDAPAAPKGPGPVGRLVLRALLVLGPWLLAPSLALRARAASAPDRVHTATILTSALLSPAQSPPRSILFLEQPETIFRVHYAQRTEGERPDLTVVPLPLLGYPGLVAHLLRSDPALDAVLARYLLRPDRGLDPRATSTLASRRPVLLDLDPHTIGPFVPVLLPLGPVAVVTPEPTTLASVRAAAGAWRARRHALTVQLETEPAAQPRVADWVLWHNAMHALFFAARGALGSCREAAERALERAPESPEMRGLRAAAAGADEHPIDIAPFLPAAAP